MTTNVRLLCIVCSLPLCVGQLEARATKVQESVPPLALSSTAATSRATPAAPTSQPKSDAPADIDTYLARETVAESTGAFTYSIPIAVPPDPFGVAPDLALSYDSQAGNGLLGVGWQLSGLSAISSCPTSPSDGVFGPLRYDGTDPVCLDGNRLLPFQGQSGADGSEYRTDLETWSKIISLGRVGSGPARFTAKTRSGLTLEYGGTADSRIEVPTSPTARAWVLNRVEDANGNYADYSYEKANNAYLITRIDYTGNRAAGILPQRSVRFHFEGRDDSAIRFVAGQITKETRRLASVETWVADRKILTYRLDYDASPRTGRSRLIRISECAGPDCLPPTTIRWAPEPSSQDLLFEENRQADDVNGAAEFIALADINGDGFPDYVCKNRDDGLNWNLFTGKGWGPSVRQTGLAALGDVESWLIDINRDGKADFVGYNANGSIQWNLALGDGTTATQWAPTRMQGGLPLQGAQRWLADINGDGFPDFIVKNNDDVIHWRLGNGAGWDTTAYSQGALCGLGDHPGHDGTPPPKSWFVDLNGDGKADYISFRSDPHGNGTLCWNFALGDGTTTAHWGITQRRENTPGHESAFATMADINGDGLPDYVTTDGGTIHWNLGTGNGFTSNLRQDNLHLYGHRLFGPQFVDLNGDHKADYVVKNDNGVIYWDLAVGDGTTASHWGPPHQQGGLQRFGTQIFSNQWNGFASWFRDLNGDGKADFISKDVAGTLRWNLASTIPTDRVVGVETPMGAKVKVDYGSLAGTVLHRSDSGSTFPLLDVQPPILAVSELSLSDGVGGWKTSRFRYTGAKADFQRRHWAGFRQIVREDLATGRQSDSVFLQSFPLQGRLLTREERLPSGLTFDRLTNEWLTLTLSATHGNTALLGSRLAERFELDGQRMSWQKSSFRYDDFGNALEDDSLDSSGLRRTVSAVYSNDPNRWVLGLPLREASAFRSPSASEVDRLTTRVFDTDGRLLQESLEPGTPNARVTDHRYDGRGQLAASTMSAEGGAPRITTRSYDDLGFLTETRNAVGHRDLYQWDAVSGKPLSHTAPDQAVTRYQYDGFGRLLDSNTEGGSHLIRKYSFDSAAGGLRVLRTEAGGEERQSDFDVLGRTTIVTTLGFDGSHVVSESVYDAQGRLRKQSRPHLLASSPTWDEFEHDELDRRVSVRLPGGQVTRITFQGLQQRTWNPLGHSTVHTYNSKGWLLEEQDSIGESTRYSYDPVGNLQTIVDAKGTVTAFEHDVYGNVTTLVDPGLGRRTFSYNGFGEFTAQQDAQGVTTRFERDDLGRVIRQIRGKDVAFWEFDSEPNATGKLAASGNSQGFSEKVSYDRYGRLAEHTVTIGTRAYDTSWSFDAYGRVEGIRYPGGLAIHNTYGANGYLSEVRDASSNGLIWKALRYDPEGRVVQSALGNGVSQEQALDPSYGKLLRKSLAGPDGAILQDFHFEYDVDGNLLGREERVAGSADHFTYDVLNRLTSWTPVYPAGGPHSDTASYDLDGNFLSQPSVGNYFYRQFGSGPHAVSCVVSPSKSFELRYDSNGSCVLGLGRKLQYGDSSLPVQVSLTTPSRRLNWWRSRFFESHFLYDSADRRIQKRTRGHQGIGLFRHSRSSAATDYVLGLYERTEWDCGELERSFVRIGGELVAVAVQLHGEGCRTGPSLGADLRHLQSATQNKDWERATSDTLFVHTDPTGSVVGVTGADGRLLSAPSYEPFGTPIETESAGGFSILGVNRGFAGREHDRELGLVNMKGRLFDPRLARFLSADPDRQFPRESQASNRYAYARNNPLRYADPTGFRIEDTGVEVGGEHPGSDPPAKESADETAKESGLTEGATKAGKSSFFSGILGKFDFDFSLGKYDGEPIVAGHLSLELILGSSRSWNIGPSISTASGALGLDVTLGHIPLGPECPGCKMEVFVSGNTEGGYKAGVALLPPGPFEKLGDARFFGTSSEQSLGLGGSVRVLAFTGEAEGKAELGSGVTRMYEDLHGGVVNMLSSQGLWMPNGW
jgi:RHS repeat-associated protein